jgi:hypothetical protein
VPDPLLDSLAAALRGSPGAWQRIDDPQRFLALATEHRVRPLLAWRLRQSGELGQWPVAIRQPLLEIERTEAAVEILRRRALGRLLQAFQAADVPLLLLKGAALAYDIYPEAWLRPREDTDLLVRPADARRAGEVLESMGLQPVQRPAGRIVSHQQLFIQPGARGPLDAYDLHWKIANPAPFADLLSTDDLLREARLLTIDGVQARVPGRVHALLLACWHRVSHHYDDEELRWLYDLHLLATAADGAELERVLAITRATRTGAVCARGFSLASACFGTHLPEAFLVDLERTVPETSPSVSAYMQRDASKAGLLAADLRALPGWRSRLSLLGETLFPPAAYMFATYGGSSRLLLPAWYLRRIAGGTARWLRRMR